MNVSALPAVVGFLKRCSALSATLFLVLCACQPKSQSEQKSARSMLDMKGADVVSTNEKIQFGFSKVDVLTLDQAVDQILTLAQDKSRAHAVFTPNADHIFQLGTSRRIDALKNRGQQKELEEVRVFREAYQKASLQLADGIPLVLASQLSADPAKRLPERVAGSDVVPALLERANSKEFVERFGRKLRLFLLGGAPADPTLNGEAEDAVDIVEKRLSHLNVEVVGKHCPPFGFEKAPQACEDIISRLNTAEADIILVGLGAPKQEKFIAEILEGVNFGVMIGVGATLDFMAGRQKRAPRIWQRLGAEWLYRILQNPGRMTMRYVRDFSVLPTLVGDSLAQGQR